MSAFRNLFVRPEPAHTVVGLEKQIADLQSQVSHLERTLAEVVREKWPMHIGAR